MEDGIRKLGRRDGEGGHVASVLDVLDLLLSYMCAQIRVWSCLVTDNFGLFTDIAVCKFLRGWQSCGLKPFYFVHCNLCVFIQFSAAFCTAHCALDLARDHAPQKCPLLLL